MHTTVCVVCAFVPFVSPDGRVPALALVKVIPVRVLVYFMSPACSWHATMAWKRAFLATLEVFMPHPVLSIVAVADL
jgi:hypothetical protein